MRVWQSDDGLPNNNVTSLAQGSDGYLWVATSGHFARFDGVHFEEFTPRTTLPSYNGPIGRVNTLLQDSRGGLWLAMYHGPIVCLHSGVPQIFTNNLPDYVVQTMVEDCEGAIWITYHGNAVCRIKDGKVTRFTAQDGLPERYDCALAADCHGHIWFCKDGQLGRFESGHFNVLTNAFGRSVRLTAAAAGGVWICSGRELFECDDSGVVTSMGTFRADISGTEPTALLEDKDGAVWIGTAADGLYRFDGSGFEKVSSSHPYISSLLQDREGDLWVGTGGGGLDRVLPRAFTLENEATGLPFGAVESICEDTRGVIWVTTQSGLLVCRTNRSWHIISNGTNWPGGRATCVTAARDGGIWIGTQNHVLYCLRDGQFTAWRTRQGFNGHVVRGLLDDANSDLWIVEEEPDLVQCLHEGQLETFNLPPAAGVPRAFCKDAAGNLWIGTSRGFLLRLRDGVISDETTNISHVYTSIRSLAATPDGNLWIGYAGWGVGQFKDGRYARISVTQGLFNDFISQIVPDGRGWLWFGSDHGIFKVSQHDLNDVAEGRAHRVLSLHYGEGNALPSLQASFGVSPNALHSHDDRLWFPTLSALAVVTLDNLHENPQPPPVLLKQVVMDDQIIASYGGAMPVLQGVDLGRPETMRLPPDHHRLEFDFTALCLSAPENVHFQCRLAGFDDDWVAVNGQWSINYSRLPAGNYQFLVRAQSGDTAWSPVSAVKFVVTPFFWDTWWFRSAVVILFTAAVIAIVRYVSFRRLRLKLHALEQQAALDKERSRIAKDIHDDVGGSLTQIKLLFELAQRNRTTPDKVEQLGQEGLAATRQIIKSMDEIVWAVNPRNDSLPHLIDYLGQFAIEFLSRAGIRCRVDLPEHPLDWAVSPEARHNLFLAVKEALNNVVLHAGADEVWLRVTATEEVLTIVIEDNGRGFNGKSPRDFADGLPNMSQRMTEIGGRSSIESKADAGTKVSLIFPKPN